MATNTMAAAATATTTNLPPPRRASSLDHLLLNAPISVPSSRSAGLGQSDPHLTENIHHHRADPLRSISNRPDLPRYTGPTWFPFPGVSPPAAAALDLHRCPQTTQQQHSSSSSSSLSPQNHFAGTFHALGSLPFGADYGSLPSRSTSTVASPKPISVEMDARLSDYASGPSRRVSFGMEALSEAAATRMREDRSRPMESGSSSSSSATVRPTISRQRLPEPRSSGHARPLWDEEYDSSRRRVDQDRSRYQHEDEGDDEEETEQTRWSAERRRGSHSPVKRKREDVQRDIDDLRLHIDELIQLMRPFAATSSTTQPAQPPLYLRNHFHRMSKLISSSLYDMSDLVDPNLLPGFRPTPLMQYPFHGPNGGKSDAEREMDVIRKRRDMLMARAAAQAKTAQHEVEQRQQRSTSAESVSSDSGSRSPSPASLPEPQDARINDAVIGDGELESHSSHSRSRIDPRDGTPLGRCHGCGWSGFAMAWREGPDGPKSLCEPCGVSLARAASRNEDRAE
ncbi:hypothetical protein BD324DRAFT_223620 [Kockovaella imperatae]|uniref:GATA-type domain-containing protein n=1 Tax=Kockovaella imperatae TaxID=4999 RepID=A0A1Y1UNI9_9TREE|nr:hypothetical protein BD324DRAFT_223620 [Kockovaella imperatae]ORX39628.1 hypothetical protein BD324DRAFT_223620 [Kockovaella imperatae]